MSSPCPSTSTCNTTVEITGPIPRHQNSGQAVAGALIELLPTRLVHWGKAARNGRVLIKMSQAIQSHDCRIDPIEAQRVTEKLLCRQVRERTGATIPSLGP